MTDIALETKVILKYVLPTKRDRYLGFIQNERTRIKFIKDLSPGHIFQDDVFVRITGPESEIIKKSISKYGFEDCYIISENKKIDGKRLSVDNALDEAVSLWSDTGTLLVFGDAEVVYRESEGINNKWISKL